MRAVVYDAFGGPEVLSIRDVEDPPLGPDTVLIRVAATSVNPVDCKVRAGRLRRSYPHHFPITPGWDVSGVVEWVGAGVVSGLRPGDEVWGYVRRDDVGAGTAAELVCAPQRTVARKPKLLSLEEAAAVPLAGLTAYQTLVELLQVRPGERLLIHAAAGGVGLFAVQIGRALGADVVGTASPRNHGFLSDLGVSEVIDYRSGPVSDQLSRPVDAVLDLVGGPALLDVVKQLGPGGRLVSVADAAGAAALGGRFAFARPEPRHLDALAALIDRREVLVHISEQLRLEQIATAHRLVEGGHTRGKVLVTI